jgi:hypothetical protein
MAITIEHKGHKITLSQRGKLLTAKVSNISVVKDAEIEVDEAIRRAKAFVDEHCAPKQEKKGLPVHGSVS